MADLTDSHLDTLLNYVAHGLAPARDLLPEIIAIVGECKRHRATMQRIAELALSLEHGFHPDQRKIGAELRNRMNGGG